MSGARVIAALAILVVCACDRSDGSEPRPNLLLIAVDTLRADHLGAYGYKRQTSPHIDRFFESAVTFDDAHSSSSWTLPAFASLMTSYYSSTHGCWQFSSRLDDSFVTLAEILRDAGYSTVGVVSHVFLHANHGLAQGFVLYDESESQDPISSPAVTARALAALERLSEAGTEAPWFLFVHYFDPHTKYQAHEGISPSWGTEPVDLYDGEIAFVDRQLGRLLKRAAELAPNTIVAFVSDHGEEFRDHQWTQHGHSLYAEVERVPLAIRAPTFDPRRVPDPVSLVDFLPTVLELLGLPARETPIAGRSLVNLMKGESALTPGILMETRLDLLTMRDVDAYISGRWKLIVTTPKHVRRPDFENSRGMSGSVMLFDRETDPRELKNVALQHPQIVARLQSGMAEAISRARSRADRFETSEAEPSADELRRLESLGYIGPAPPSR